MLEIPKFIHGEALVLLKQETARFRDELAETVKPPRAGTPGYISGLRETLPNRKVAAVAVK